MGAFRGRAPQAQAVQYPSAVSVVNDNFKEVAASPQDTRRGVTVTVARTSAGRIPQPRSCRTGVGGGSGQTGEKTHLRAWSDSNSDPQADGFPREVLTYVYIPKLIPVKKV